MRKPRIAALRTARYAWQMKPCFAAVLIVLPALMAACELAPDGRSASRRYFETQVRPVLQKQCLACHNGTLPPPSLNLTSKATAFQHLPGGRHFIVPGDPGHSLLIAAVERGGTHPRKMPHADLSLTDDQIGLLREWIADGATWPEGRAGTLHAQASAEH